MLPTTSEKYFGQAFFDSVVEWIKDNLDPDEVFSQRHLTEWIKDNLCPEEIFDDEVLAEWAIANGYKEA